MEAWMVLARTGAGLKDVPLSLWPTEAEAEGAARRADARAVSIAFREVFGMDAMLAAMMAETASACVVPFRFGVPGTVRIVKEIVA